MTDDGLLESFSLVGVISLCCIGFGGIAGAAVISGGLTSGSAIAIGATDWRGALVSGFVTFATVLLVTAILKWKTSR